MAKSKNPIPHSWPINAWPASVFPGSPQRGAYVCRANRQELMNCGAIARVGKTLVIIGSRYERFLELRTADVAGFQIAPNLPVDEVAA